MGGQMKRRRGHSEWWRGELVGVLLGVAIVGACLSEGKRSDYSCEGCNVVLISADTLRADRLGTYGYGRDTSPALDAFADEAILFEDVTAQAPWTLPSHMSMFTGLYPFRHGVVDGESKLSDAAVTLADILHENGYTTVAFTGGGYVSRSYNYHRFDVFNQKGGTAGRNFDAMIEWLRQSSSRPFFLFWHDFQVHCPYVPDSPNDLFSDPKYDGIVDLEPNANDPLCADDDRPSCRNKCGAYFQKIYDRMDAKDTEYVRDKYDGEVRQLDAKIKRILETLRERGLEEDTVVAFTSDHGEALVERGQVGHGVMYQPVLRVPLILRIPGTGASRVHKPVELVDVMPTLLEAVGISAPEGVDGDSLLPPGKQGREDATIFSEDYLRGGRFALRSGRFKMIWDDRRGGFELYDIREDPGETTDLSDRRPELASRLRAELKARMRKGRAAQSEGAQVDEATRKQLEALGYATQ